MHAMPTLFSIGGVPGDFLPPPALCPHCHLPVPGHCLGGGGGGPYLVAWGGGFALYKLCN